MAALGIEALRVLGDTGVVAVRDVTREVRAGKIVGVAGVCLAYYEDRRGEIDLLVARQMSSGGQ